MSPDDTGQRIGDRYLLRCTLGSGGAGTVWLADDEVLQRSVAVKAVHVPDTLPDAERTTGRQRVLREGRAAARLSHPGAVTVFDVFEEGGCAYLVMELVRAPSLATLVDDGGPLPPARVAEVGLHVLGALEAAHGRGIVHRDVKPSNVLVPEAGGAKLTDFGIATVSGDSRMTATGLVLGSPAYMAPEQARDGAAGPPADLWGLGATLYFAVEGVPPFVRGQPLATVHAVLHDEPRPAERAGPLEPLLADLLAKEPGARPAIDEVRRRLQAVRDADAAAATTRRLRPEPAGAVPGGQASREAAPATGPMADAPPWWRRRAAVAVAALLLLAAATGAGALLGGAEDGGELAGEEPPAAGDPAPAGEEDPAAEDPASEPAAPATEDAPTQPADEAPPDGSDDLVPEGWTTYTDDLGWSIAHPPDWEVVERSGTIVDFRDPDSPTYMRVDFTDDPPASAVGAWEEMSAAFAAERTNYRELRIDPVTFQGFEGALWEYTYTEGGLDLHAANLGFGTDEFGQALNFQTAAGDWEEQQDLHEWFRRSFRPAAA